MKNDFHINPSASRRSRAYRLSVLDGLRIREAQLQPEGILTSSVSLVGEAVSVGLPSARHPRITHSLCVLAGILRRLFFSNKASIEAWLVIYPPLSCC